MFRRRQQSRDNDVYRFVAGWWESFLDCLVDAVSFSTFGIVQALKRHYQHSMKLTYTNITYYKTQYAYTCSKASNIMVIALNIMGL